MPGENVYLGFGSNQGDRIKNIVNALNKIASSDSIRIKRISSLYESEPMYIRDQPYFLNALAEVETDLNPHQLLQWIKKVEVELGREKSTVKFGPRLIDIDIILYDDLIISGEDLIIPHPLYTERKFVLLPLVELSPKGICPLSGKIFSILLSKCKDSSEVIKHHRQLENIVS